MATQSPSKRGEEEGVGGGGGRGWQCCEEEEGGRDEGLDLQSLGWRSSFKKTHAAATTQSGLSVRGQEGTREWLSFICI